MQKLKYIWKADGGENMCDLCAALDGTEYASLEVVPELPHPNCKCMIKQIVAGKLIRPHPWTGHDAPKTRYGDPIYIKPDGSRSVHPGWDSPFNRTNFSPNGMARLAEWGELIKKEREEKLNPKDIEFSRTGMMFLKDKENKIVDKDERHIIYDDATMKPVSDGQVLPNGATIGYGHLIKTGEDFSKGISEKEAIDLFKQDICYAESVVKNNILTSINQHQFDGLVSLAYNIGAGNFKNSTIVKYINDPDFKSKVYPTPEEAWKIWNKSQGKVSKGLIKRRNEDWNIYENGIY